MADSGFQLTLNALARVVGGTVTTDDPHFFSGLAVGDGSGISGLRGCHSTPPGKLAGLPVGLILPGPGHATLTSQGAEDEQDDVQLLIFVANFDPKREMATLTPYRDSVRSAFRAHMSAYGTASIFAFARSWRPGVHTYAGVDYFGWDFTIDVSGVLSVTYAP